MNTALRRGMADANLTARQLAGRVGVTPKTVERWLADEALIPHPRNRADVSDALGVDELMLWPSAVRGVLKTGPDRELIAAYPYRSACPTSVWASLIGDATTDITFAGYTNYFVWLEQPALHQTLRRKAESGCRVRFLLGHPESSTTRQREAVEDVALTVSTRIRITLEHLDKLSGVPGVEARYSAPEDGTNHVSLSVFRFDAHALVTPHLARLVGHDSPMMHLRRMQDGGMFDRFAEHADELWGRGTAIA
ncbi:XRE family transcriptional regulator [Yinghuangia seranimata]|uniref:XRE family transcriptional regulator n=1 Tax=Yinghuangia seranimata TaxID=408067 RepID=UPI00248B3B36|nr:XRE family transcriptional regulator [Yinghuangia seranimata]MDI2127808.1 XRE family transcriptional regulator [Yinghuangia seranimata]